MRFSTNRRHHTFFHRYKYIEFNDLLTQEEAYIFSQRLTKTLQYVDYDIWRYNRFNKQFILHSKFAEIASNLTKIRPIRIAFDQLFYTLKDSDLLTNSLSLNEISCIQGIICGCILSLPRLLNKYPSSIFKENHFTSNPIAPQKIGNGVFFTPDLPLNFDYLIHTPNTLQLLIVYAEYKSLYTYQKINPYTHTLKKFGYVFGDRLKNSTHPVLFSG